MVKAGRTFAGAVLLAAAFGGCIVPSEAGKRLVVTLDAIPRLTEGDTLSLSAHVLDGSVEVPNSQVQFTVTNPSAASASPTNGYMFFVPPCQEPP